MAEVKKLKIDDSELKDLLSKKGEIITSGRALSKEIEDKNAELQKMGYEVDRLKEQIKPIVEKHKTDNGYDIYDIATNVEINDEGEIVVDIVNVIEDFKEQYAIQYYKNPDVEEATQPDLAEGGADTEVGEGEIIEEEDKK